MAYITLKVAVEDHIYAELTPNDTAALEAEFGDWWQASVALDEITERVKRERRKHRAAGRTKSPVALAFERGNGNNVIAFPAERMTSA